MPPVTQLRALPNDSPGATRETLKLMEKLVRAGKLALPVNDMALRLTRAIPQKDYVGEVRALFSFVQNNIRYVRDITGYETLRTPEKTLEVGGGDCDDKSVLLAALLESIGHPTRFVAIGFEPNTYHHVYVETLVGKQWVALDATECRPAGWNPATGPIEVKAKMVHNNR